MDRRDRLLVEESIKSDVIDLDVDETAKSVCPFCRAKHEESFSITRTNEGLIYNCFRATCTAHGFISSMAGTIPPETKDIKLKPFKPKEFTKPLEPLPQYVLDMMFDRYELTEEELNEQQIRFCRDEYRLFMPTFDYTGDTFGGVSKTLSKGVRKFKTINYFTRQSSRLSYPRTKGKRGSPIAIVEDILSAIRVSRHVKCVAALGHTLSIEQIKEIRSQTDHLILMLDGDVFHKALATKKKFGFYFRNFSVIYLSNLDPKDMKDKDLKEIINETINT